MDPSSPPGAQPPLPSGDGETVAVQRDGETVAVQRGGDVGAPPPGSSSAPAPPSSAPAGAQPPGSWWSQVSATPVSYALVAVQVAAFAWVTFTIGDTSDARVLVRAGALERGAVWAGGWWRLLGAAFLHSGWLHLGVNVVFGLSWTRTLERLAGPARFLGLYLASALGGSAASLLWGDTVSVGASGALFGMIGATLALHRRALPGWWAFARSPVTVSVVLQLGVWTAAAVFGGLRVDHAAHLGGLATGGAATWALSDRRRRRPLLAGLGLALLAACLAAAWPRPGLTAYAGRSLEAEAFEALRREDLAGAEAALARLRAGGRDSAAARYLAGELALQRGEVDAAEAAARRLLSGEEDAQVRAAAARLLYGVAVAVFNGERGRPREPERGYLLVKEACAAGFEAACRAERRLRTGEDEPGAR